MDAVMAGTPNNQQKDDAGNTRANPDPPGRRSKLVPEHLVNFLENLRNTGNVSLSSRQIGWSRATIYKFANQNPSFKDAMKEAMQEGRELLIGEAWKRATQWTTYQYGKESEPQVKPPSDRLLGLLIQGYFPQFKPSHTEVNPGDGLVTESADLTKLSNDELDALEKILTKVGGNVNALGTSEG